MRNLWGSSTSHYVEYPYQSSFMADDTEYYGKVICVSFNVLTPTVFLIYITLSLFLYVRR